MTKMSIEEKAKAYNEALELARKIKNGEGDWRYSDLTEITPALTEIFPELRESEDERIVREMLEYFTITRQSDFCSRPDRQAWIAWLEKQKEQKLVEFLSEEKVFAIMKKLTSLSFCVPLGSDEEKQIHEITCDVRSLLDYPIKPVEWSEEDEQRYISIRTALEVSVILEKEEYDANVEWLRDFVNSVKYRSPQPKPEWSEEDEKIMQTMIKEGDLKPSEIAWLKSLHPTKDCNGCSKHLEGYISGRSDAENKLLDMYGILLMPDGELRMKPQWKPSEEQMSMLRAVINEPNNAGAESCQIALRCIYEHLKKL